MGWAAPRLSLFSGSDDYYLTVGPSTLLVAFAVVMTAVIWLYSYLRHQQQQRDKDLHEASHPLPVWAPSWIPLALWNAAYATAAMRLLNKGYTKVCDPLLCNYYH